MSVQSITLAGHLGHALAASISGPDDGFPVILAHGGGQTRRAWRAITQLLASHGFRTIAFDMRGHGESAWASDGAYDISDFGADLVEICRTTHKRPAVIGASLGGLAGIVAEGSRAPGSFGSLTLVDVTPQMEPEGVARVVGFMAAHARDGFASVEHAARVISDYLPHRPNRKASSGLAHYLRRKDDGRFYWHWDPAFIERSMRQRAVSSDLGSSELSAASARLTLPVHLVRGGSSDLVSLEAVAHFQELVPHMAYSDIADATHMVVGDKNDAFGQAILAFLLATHETELGS
ncbi:MAG: peroxidase [Sphingopyxis sp. RIFCSPHIGHO2_01_FULL_65_24]|nr:MAG: peroxidase [Sphingopyxis sp. RIFCSPHIGHO2_01_FULL_65_24]